MNIDIGMILAQGESFKVVEIGMTTQFNLREDSLKLIEEISETVHGSLDLGEVCDEIIRLACKVTQPDSAFLYLYDPVTRTVVLTASKNPHPHEVGRVRLRLGEGITGWVAQHRATVAISENAQQDPHFKLIANLPEDEYETFLSVPLLAKDQMVGVLNIQHKEPRPFQEDEVSLLELIGKLAGSAIANAQLYEAMQKKSQQLATLSHITDTVVNVPCAWRKRDE